MSAVRSAESWTRAKVAEARAFYFGTYSYVYGFPLVMMSVTKDVLTAAPSSGEYRAPINQFFRIRGFVSPDFKDVVRISVNSLWSTAFVDLDREPFVFSHADTGGRYMVAQVMNMWTDNFASIGSRTTGSGPGSCLIAGPKWIGSAPADIRETYRCSTRFAWILVQLAAAGPEEFPEVNALQDQLRLTPLSSWGEEYKPPDNVPVDPGVDTTATPFDQVRLMDGKTFFKRLAKAMNDNPPYPGDGSMLKKLENLGVRPGHDFDVDRLDPASAKGLTRAARWVWGSLQSGPYTARTVNGWLLPVNLGRFGTDYKTRAFIAFVGLGALWSDDCVYPSAFVDGDGRALDGAGQYRLHFASGRLFPSHSGVWSISAYRENFYVHNPIERYGVTSGMPLEYNADGSLDIYIQAASPGPDKEANWLPCPPSGLFNLTVRVYQPKHAMIDGRTEGGVLVEAGSYTIPPIERIT